MVLEPWQVFLGGCLIGALISFIVLTALIVNTIGRIGIKGIHLQNLNNDDFEEDTDEEQSEADLLARLSFILLSRGLITDDDIDFMKDNISFDEWKHKIDKEIDNMKESNKDDKSD